MSNQARVGNIDALKEFRTTLCLFASKSATALDEAASDVDRVLFWLKQDQHSFWKAEHRKRAEQYAKARLDLKNKKDLDHSFLGGKKSFIDEKKALMAAQKRIEEADKKLKAVQRWIIKLEQETYSYKSMSSGLQQFLEKDIPNARNRLDRMIDALEAYAFIDPDEATATTTFADSTQETDPKEKPESEGKD